MVGIRKYIEWGVGVCVFCVLCVNTKTKQNDWWWLVLSSSWRQNRSIIFFPLLSPWWCTSSGSLHGDLWFLCFIKGNESIYLFFNPIDLALFCFVLSKRLIFSFCWRKGFVFVKSMLLWKRVTLARISPLSTDGFFTFSKESFNGKLINVRLHFTCSLNLNLISGFCAHSFCESNQFLLLFF